MVRISSHSAATPFGQSLPTDASQRRSTQMQTNVAPAHRQVAELAKRIHRELQRAGGRLAEHGFFDQPDLFCYTTTCGSYIPGTCTMGFVGNAHLLPIGHNHLMPRVCFFVHEYKLV